MSWNILPNDNGTYTLLNGSNTLIRLHKQIKIEVVLQLMSSLEEMEFLRKTASVYEPNVFIDNDQLRSRFTTEQLTKMLKKSGIPTFKVNSLQEELSIRKAGYKSKLFVNEVIISK